MTDVQRTPETELSLIDAVLADLGTIDRRSNAGTLTEADYRVLIRRSRDRLRRLRQMHDPEALELTDAGAAALAAMEKAADAARNPRFRDLIARAPGLMTARQLLDAGVEARRYGPLAAVDGGLS